MDVPEVTHNAARCGVRCRKQTDCWSEEDRPRLLGSMIAALADSPVNDEFPNAESKEVSEIVVVGSAATLANSESGTASWLVEIQC